MPPDPRPTDAVERSVPARATITAGTRACPGLHVVATPIGNLADITIRALDTLRTADVIACEDTRVTGRLLAAYSIATAMTPYHDHNAERARPALIERLKKGEAVALVSDAGTPLISDPGYRLVRAALADGLVVSVAPGPSATIAALVISGLPTDRFHFAGFLPAKSAARRAALAQLAGIDGTLVLLESAPRLAAALADMAMVLGARPAAIARELTKLHEEVRRGSLGELAQHYLAAGPPKGEIVVVIGPPDVEAAPLIGDEELDRRIADALRTHSRRDAAAIVAAETGLPRRQVYSRALALAGEREDAGV